MLMRSQGHRGEEGMEAWEPLGALEVLDLGEDEVAMEEMVAMRRLPPLPKAAMAVWEGRGDLEALEEEAEEGAIWATPAPTELLLL
jgi:hypothetical protein